MSRVVTLSQSPWYLLITRLWRLALIAIIIIGFSSIPRQVSTAQTNGQWYKTDLHVHSAFSSDAHNDLGILSQAAKSLGYNALFLTDHNLASSFSISGLTANRMVFEDSYRRWASGTYGSPSSTTNVLAAAPVNTGTNSLHLASSSSGSGETYVWTNRGPNFRSGDIILKVSIYPTRIDPGSGVYVSASIGGDVTVQSPNGYTTSSGVISPGKTTVLVWQIGSARTASTDPNARVLTYSLGSYTLNAWNHYTINVSDYLANIPPADRPLDYNGLTYLKMAAAGNGGTANAYFDTYSITASAPVPPADEFVYRSSLIHNYDTSTFKIFPAVELGTGKHAQRLNFEITAPSQFVSYTNGIDGILPAQQSGYPAMLNHPGSDGGVTSQEAISTQGEGADLMEVRQQPWIDNWDAVLKQGVQLLGTGTTDTHRVFSGSSYATYVYGPALTFDSLTQSIFEGRTYIAVGSFGDQGRVIFNLESGSQQPYPARYPVYVSDAQTSANVHMQITSGLLGGYTMRWYRNGVLTATDNQTGASYDATKSIPLSGAFTYVRAEIRSSSGSLKGLTQPIFFVDIPGLPVDKSLRVDKVMTASGNGYNKLLTKGITTASWNATDSALSMTLENPTNALVNLLVTSNSAPQQVMVNGVTIAASSSLANFEAATSSAWYYDASIDLLYLKVKHPVAITNVVIGFSGIFPTPTNIPTPTKTPTPTATSVSTPVGPGTYDDTNSNWSYSSGWTAWTGSGPANNTSHYTSTVDSSAELMFTGTGFILTYAKYPSYGLIDVYVDGTKIDTIDAYSPTLVWQATWASPGYTLGTHTVRFVFAGAAGKYVDIDAIQILDTPPPAPVPPGTYDDTNSNWSYSSGWTAWTGSGPLNGSSHYTSTVGSSAELMFTGTRFILTYAKYPSYGLIDVYVDGTKIDTIDAYSPTLVWQATWASPGYPLGTHTMRFVFAGAAGKYVDIDAIQILDTVAAPPGTYDDTSGYWSYSSGWTAWTGSGPLNDSSHYTSTVGSSAQMTFSGTGFTLTYAKYPSYGLIDVYVDGTKIDTINAYSPTLVWQATWTSPGLAAGNHTVRLVHAGGGTYIDIDAIEVH